MPPSPLPLPGDCKPVGTAREVWQRQSHRACSCRCLSSSVSHTRRRMLRSDQGLLSVKGSSSLINDSQSHGIRPRRANGIPHERVSYRNWIAYCYLKLATSPHPLVFFRSSSDLMSNYQKSPKSFGCFI